MTVINLRGEELEGDEVNQDVVEVLAKMLELAKVGDIKMVAIVALGRETARRNLVGSGNTHALLGLVSRLDKDINRYLDENEEEA